MASLKDNILGLAQKAGAETKAIGEKVIKAKDIASDIIDKASAKVGAEIGEAVSGYKALKKDLASVETADKAVANIAGLASTTGKNIASTITSAPFKATETLTGVGRGLGATLGNIATGKKEIADLKAYTPDYLSGVASKFGEAVASIPENAVNFTINANKNAGDISNTISDYRAGNISGAKASGKIAKNILGTTADATGVAFSVLAPVIAPAISTILDETGFSKESQRGQERTFSSLADTLGLEGESKRDLVDSLKSVVGIASAGFGIKGAKIASKGGLKNVAKGTYTATAPDVTFATIDTILNEKDRRDTEGGLGEKGLSLASGILAGAPIGGKRAKSEPTKVVETKLEPTKAPLTTEETITKQLPESLARATPNFGYSGKNFKVSIKDPVALASYIIRDPDKLSKNDSVYLKFVMDSTGLNESASRALGKQVHANIKDNIEKGITKNGVVEFTDSIQIDKTPTKTPTKIEENILYGNKSNEARASATTREVPGFIITSKPRFGEYKLEISDPVKKAAYMIREGKELKPESKKFIDYVMGVTGFSEADARKIGTIVHSQIKEKINNGDTKNKTVFITEVSPIVKDDTTKTRRTVTAPTRENKSVTQKILEETTGKPQSKEDVVNTVREIENVGETKPEPTKAPLTPEETIKVMDESGFSDGTPSPVKAPKKGKIVKALKGGELTDELNAIQQRNSIEGYTPERGNILTRIGGVIGTVGGALDTIKLKVGDYNVDLSAVTRRVKESDKAYTNTILDDIRKDTTYIPKTEIKKVADSDIIGGVLPNDLSIVGEKGVSKIREKYEDKYFNEVLAKNEAFLTPEEKANLKALAFNQEIYLLNKGRPEVIDRLFTKEEQAMYDAQIAKEAQINKEIGDMLGFDFGKEDSGYVRFVLSPSMSKNAKPSELTFNFWGTGDRQYASYADAIKDLSLAKKISKNVEGRQINKDEVRRLASILKEKSEGLDLFRYHSPALRMLDYAREVGTLKRNEDIVKVFTDLAKSKDKKVKSQLSDIIKSGAMESLLSLGEPVGLGKKAAQRVSGVLLAANPVPAGQAITSSGLRGAILSGANKITTQIGKLTNKDQINPVEIAKDLGIDVKGGGLYDKATTDVLTELGIIGEFQFLSKNIVGKTVNKLAEYGSGAPIEQSIKRVVGLSEMRSILQNDGIDVSGNPKEIATTFKEWSLDPSNKDAYLRAVDRIESQMRFIGDVSAFSKSNIKVLNDYGFTALQPYLYNRVNVVLRDVARTADGIERVLSKEIAVKSPEAKEALRALSRQLADVGIYMGATAIASKTLMEAYDVTEEVADKMAANLIGKMYGGNPVLYTRQLIEGVLSNPAFVAGDIGFKAIGFIVASVLAPFAQEDDNLDKLKVRLFSVIESVVKPIGGTKIADAVSMAINNKTTLGNIAEAMGLVDPTGQTKMGYAKGFKDDNVGEYLMRIYGGSADKAIEEILYKKLDSAEYGNKFGPIAGPVVSAASNMLGNVTLGISNLSDSAKSINPLDNQAVNNRAEQIQVRNVINAIDGSESVADALKKLDVDEAGEALVKEEINAIIKTVSKSNKKIADLIGVDGTTVVTDAGFSEFMNILEKENPDSYNKIISGMTKLSQGYTGDKLENEAQIENIKRAFGQSSINIDSGISSVRGTNPNTVSFVNTMEQELKDVTSPDYVAKNGKEKALEELKNLDAIYATIYNNMPVTQGLERAFALSGLTRSTLIETLLKVGVTGEEIQGVVPNLLQSMERGLEYRGFRPKGEETSKSSIITELTKGAQTETKTGPSQKSPSSQVGTAEKGAIAQNLLAYPINEKPVKVEAKQVGQPITRTISEGPSKTTLADLLRLSKK